MNPRTFRLMLLVNGCVALVTTGLTLVLLLIAPLGLAAVITITLLVATLTMGGGVAADLVLWRLLPGTTSRGASLPAQGMNRLPERRQR